MDSNLEARKSLSNVMCSDVVECGETEQWVVLCMWEKVRERI
jgi:hypothetical protein